jgi:MPBQ/MSBQ methyltransferase
MKKNLARIATIKDLDLELQSCSDIVKLKSLHYGYWAPNDPLTVENFLSAQIRYTETLLTLIPDGVRAILDVGCGIGDVSLSLVKKGFIVTAISPDKNHKRYFDDYDHKDLKFIETKFESFRTDEKFDFIL